MKSFIVRTTEVVEGTYLVSGVASEEEARMKFGHENGEGLIRWDGVEQTDYMAFEVDVRNVEEVS